VVAVEGEDTGETVNVEGVTPRGVRGRPQHRKQGKRATGTAPRFPTSTDVSEMSEKS